MASYPQSFDLSQASTSRNPQPVNTQKTARSVRDPSKTVMSAVGNPYLPGSDWECIPRQSQAGPETIGSQTTGSVVDAAAFNNTAGHAQSGLFKTNVEALNALDSDSVSNAHRSSGFPTSCVNGDVMSTADTAASSQPENKDAEGPDSSLRGAINLSHVGSWANNQ